MAGVRVVDLAPGVEDNALAVGLADRIRRALKQPRRAALFRKIRGSIGLVAHDLNTALTLRFDFGRLTIHEGLVGVATITIVGSASEITALGMLPFGRPWISAVLRRSERVRLKALRQATRRGSLRIYGLISHPRLAIRFLELVAGDEPLCLLDE